LAAIRQRVASASDQVLAGAAVEPQRSDHPLKTSSLPCASVALYDRAPLDGLKLRSACGGVMGEDGRFDVAGTFDERCGYVGTASDSALPSLRSRWVVFAARSRR
jgi:hypothetical protein